MSNNTIECTDSQLLVDDKLYLKEIQEIYKKYFINEKLYSSCKNIQEKTSILAKYSFLNSYNFGMIGQNLLKSVLKLDEDYDRYIKYVTKVCEKYEDSLVDSRIGFEDVTNETNSLLPSAWNSSSSHRQIINNDETFSTGTDETQSGTMQPEEISKKVLEMFGIIMPGLIPPVSMGTENQTTPTEDGDTGNNKKTTPPEDGNTGNNKKTTPPEDDTPGKSKETDTKPGKTGEAEGLKDQKPLDPKELERQEQQEKQKQAEKKAAEEKKKLEEVEKIKQQEQKAISEEKKKQQEEQKQQEQKQQEQKQQDNPKQQEQKQQEEQKTKPEKSKNEQTTTEKTVVIKEQQTLTQPSSNNNSSHNVNVETIETQQNEKQSVDSNTVVDNSLNNTKDDEKYTGSLPNPNAGGSTGNNTGSTSKSSGSSVVPIAVGLGAAVAGGIGIKAIHDHKKNSQFDDQNEDSVTNGNRFWTDEDPNVVNTEQDLFNENMDNAETSYQAVENNSVTPDLDTSINNDTWSIEEEEIADNNSFDLLSENN